jgi:WD40 repeat protein
MEATEASKLPRRRRWLRFSLRAMLLIVAIVAVWLGFKTRDARNQRTALTAIRQAGGTPYFDYQLVNNTNWNLNATPPGPDWLRKIVGEEYFEEVVGVGFEKRSVPPDEFGELLKQLCRAGSIKMFSAIETQRSSKSPRRIYELRQNQAANPSASRPGILQALSSAFFHAPGTQILDVMLEPIGKIESLESLYLANNAISDVGLKQLQNLRRLETLDLSDTDIKGPGLQYLPIKLTQLDLRDTSIDDAALEHVGKLINLEHLNLSGTAITDAGLKYLSGLNKLKDLDLSNTCVTATTLQFDAATPLSTLNLRDTLTNDDGLQQISKLRDLETLLVDETEISDAGLVHLQNLKKLSVLNANNHTLSNTGLESFKPLKQLKQLVIRSGSITYDAVFRLQEALPTTRISANPLLSSLPETDVPKQRKWAEIRKLPEPARQQRLSELDAPSDDFATRRFVSRELMKEAAASPDPDGAKWKIQLQPSSRKETLIGRPSQIPVDPNLFPWRNYLITRGSRGDAGPFDWLQLKAPALQLVGSHQLVACTLTTEDPETKGDVLFFSRMGISRTPVTLHGHKETPWRIILPPSPFPRQLVSCSDDGTMRLWNLDDHSRIQMPGPNGTPGWNIRVRLGEEIARFPLSQHDSEDRPARGEFAAFSPHGKWLATACNHSVAFRSPQSGREEFSWDLPADVMALRFDPNGNFLFAFVGAAASDEPSAKFYQFDLDARQATEFRGVHGVVDGHALVDEKTIVTWDGSGEIVFWDLATRAEIASLRVAPNHVYDVAFSPRGDVMATAGDDDEVKFWNLAKREQMETKQTFRHTSVDLVQFAYDGRALFTGSEDGWLKCWDAPQFALYEPEIPKLDIGVNAEVVTETFKDGTVRVTKSQEGTVTETKPDGTVKTTRHQ